MKVEQPMTEAEFLASVTDVANLGQWFIYHTYDSRRSQAGFPDLVLAKNGRVIFAELKTKKGRVRPDQQMWLDELEKHRGIEVYLWRPADMDFIVKTLLGRQLA